QRVGQQPKPAAQVEQRRGGAAQCIAHTRVQRIAAKLAAAVVVVPTVAEQAVGQERGGDRVDALACQRARGRFHQCSPSSRSATGNASRIHSSYIAAEGCRPSSTSIAFSAPRLRLIPVMSTKATPRRSLNSSAMAL